MRELEGRTEALAGTFNAQEVANTLWAYARMGREPGAAVFRAVKGRAEAVLDGRAEAEACTFTAQAVANSGKHAVSVCDGGADARGRSDEGNGGAAGGAGGLVQRAERGKHAVGGRTTQCRTALFLRWPAPTSRWCSVTRAVSV
jgi:hypothetical protein